MSNEAIISKVEAIDTVVRTFAYDIEAFKDDVGYKMNELDSSMSRLSYAWSGDLHDRFAEKMAERQIQIRNSLKRANALKEQLNEISAEMAQMLSVLRASGDDL